MNVDGEVIGINTAVAASSRGTSAENIGFAIAVDRVTPVIERLRRSTEAGPTSRLGVTSADATGATRGAEVTNVTPGSAADAAGVEVGDIVVEVGGLTVVDANSLLGAVRTFPPGRSVDVVVRRAGREVRLTAILDASD